MLIITFLIVVCAIAAVVRGLWGGGAQVMIGTAVFALVVLGVLSCLKPKPPA